MEVERIELSSLANYELTTTCLVLRNLTHPYAKRVKQDGFAFVELGNLPLKAAEQIPHQETYDRF